MKRRSFLAFLGTVVPAAALTKGVEPQPLPILAPPPGAIRLRKGLQLVGGITTSATHTEYGTMKG